MTYNDIGGWMLVILAMWHYGFYPIHWLLFLIPTIRKRPVGVSKWDSVKSYRVPDNFRTQPIYVLPALLLIGLLTLWFVAGLLHMLLS